MHTYRIETNEAGNPEVWIDLNGEKFIHQPHHPNAENFAPWSSAVDAEAWAIEWVNKLNNPPAQVEKLEL